MLPTPRPLNNLQVAYELFRLIEWDSAQIGSGRPQGSRTKLWGAVVVPARTALERSLKQIGETLCNECNPKCTLSLDPQQFETYFKKHNKPLSDHLGEHLHIALYYKSTARSGNGSGEKKKGPISKREMLDHFAALSHVRNGFAHLDPRKMNRLPATAKGTLWVPTHDNSSWTIQKPHALSAIRFSESFYRYIVYSVWGEQTALGIRRQLPRLMKDNAPSVKQNPKEIAKEILQLLETNNAAEALTKVEELKKSVYFSHDHKSQDLGPPRLHDPTEATQLELDFITTKNGR